jgi:hypothetical protein
MLHTFIYNKDQKTIENIFHPIWVHLTPHTGPAYQVIREWTVWKTHENCNLESAYAKIIIFSH